MGLGRTALTLPHGAEPLANGAATRMWKGNRDYEALLGVAPSGCRPLGDRRDAAGSLERFFGAAPSASGEQCKWEPVIQTVMNEAR